MVAEIQMTRQALIDGYTARPVNSLTRHYPEALVRRLYLIWELGRVGNAYGDMLDWLNQLGYHITVCGIDCPEEEALKRHERRLRDPADLLQFGRDPAWYPPPQPEANDL
jgi:hypothetical protein